ncbi:ABC transporter permease [Verticiella sediminum]|uniref:ABC transporter permease n=1 Tax=Verticiella sediminum TaxID=1247510 RepID=A0A556AV40_9BURK|nr:ABC transporter permease [Verticiella sediminum]TSH96818.1 ABC transporter permease [Verticiella sediminum]
MRNIVPTQTRQLGATSPLMESGVARLVQLLRDRPRILGMASVILFFLAWEFYGRDVNPLFLSYPSEIAKAAWAITRTGELQAAFLTSMIPFGIGLAISCVAGVLIGVLMGQVWWIDQILQPFLNAFYAVPRIALVPLIILWAGLETGGKAAIIVSIAIFPVIINTYAGIKDVRGALLDIGRAYCASPLQAFWKITFPAALPFILTGIRLAIGLAIIGLVVAEFFTAVSGLGGLIVVYANSFATAKLFVPIIAIGIFGALVTHVVSLLENRLLSWRDSESKRQ